MNGIIVHLLVSESDKVRVKVVLCSVCKDVKWSPFRRYLRVTLTLTLNDIIENKDSDIIHHGNQKSGYRNMKCIIRKNTRNGLASTSCQHKGSGIVFHMITFFVVVICQTSICFINICHYSTFYLVVKLTSINDLLPKTSYTIDAYSCVHRYKNVDFIYTPYTCIILLETYVMSKCECEC